MPRKPRIFIEGGTCRVYCRASRGEAVFADDAEAAEFIGIFQRIKERDGLVVFAWALMSNHHLALRAAEVPLWRSMASIQGLTTKGFNRRHRVYGPLWQATGATRRFESSGRSWLSLVLKSTANGSAKLRLSSTKIPEVSAAGSPAPLSRD